jgi:predicted DNA-binding mobile mystery protein A
MVSERDKYQARRMVDQNLPIAAMIDGKPMPSNGWIRTIREALGMTQKELGRRIGVNQKTVHALEIAEAQQRIRVDTLQRAAAALSCDLRYVLVPRESLEESYEHQIWGLAVHRYGRAERSLRNAGTWPAVPAATEVQELKRILRRRYLQWDVDCRHRRTIFDPEPPAEFCGTPEAEERWRSQRMSPEAESADD